MACGWKQDPAGGFLKFGMSFQKVFHLQNVFFGFDTACGIEEGSAGTDKRSKSIQNFFLKSNNFRKTLSIKSPRNIGPSPRHSRVGTGRINENQIERFPRKMRFERIHFNGFYGEHGKTFEILLHGPDSESGTIRRSEIRMTIHRIIHQHGLSARSRTCIKHLSPEEGPAEDNTHRGCGILNVNSAIQKRL